MKISILMPVYNRKKLLYNTLQSYSYFYSNNFNIEIVIVDDCSNEDNQFPNIIDDFKDLNIQHIRINKKRGYNPSYAYNVAARHAKNEIFVLTSPEILHTVDFIKLCNNFKDFKESDYYIFSVFCITDLNIKNMLCDENIHIEEKINTFNSIKHELYLNLGLDGYNYFNKYGSWYLHEIYRPSRLNFLTALSRNIYYKMCGFNEAYMAGTGSDDYDFLDRLAKYIKKYFWFEAVSVHIEHDLAIIGDQNSNHNLYISNQPYFPNDFWGKL